MRPFLLITMLIYLLLGGYQLTLPGLHYDETFEAVPAMQLLHGQPVTTFRQSGLPINGQTYPLMTQDYIGALNTYAALPFIAMLGPTPLALRLMSLLSGLLTLWLAYLVARQLTNSPRVGLVVSMLLAVDPTFIFWNRQTIFVTALTAPIGLGMLYCALRRLDSGLLRWSMGAAFLAGLGLYAKFLFLWLIFAMVVSGLLLIGPALWTHRPTPRELGACSGAFLLGCWPLLLYNWQTGGTFLNISQNAGTSYYGVNNLAFADNLATRGGQFLTLLNGSHLWYLGDIIHNPLPGALFSLILLLTMLLTMRYGPTTEARRALFPFMLIGGVLLASIGTVSALWITHFAVLHPWPSIAMGVGGWFVGRQLPPAVSPFTRRAIGGLALSLLLLTNLISVVSYQQALTESGGLSTHSDAIYELTAWLQTEHPHAPVVAMDWGLAAPITYLTSGQVTPVEVFGYAWQADVDLQARFADFVAQPETLYLWRAPDEVIFDRSGEFKAFYQPRALQENIEAAFYERSGRPLLGVTRLVPHGKAVNPPQ